MAETLSNLQYHLLRKMYPRSPDLLNQTNAPEISKLCHLGEDLVDRLRGKVVIDFGCGHGAEAVEIAQLGARLVIGLDIQEEFLAIARKAAIAAGVQDRCIFATSTAELADIIVSIDAFEHFNDPAGILETMHRLLKPGGEAFISFGPTWYHPLGGHLFSVFPWAHLIFSEKALVRWRSTFKSDGATRFGEVAGGLNQITVRKFGKLVSNSEFSLSQLERVPIAKLRPIHNRVTQEFTTALVRGKLIK